MNLNKAFILGNLTRDPELRQTPSGQAVCSFGVATNRFYTDSTGQKQKQAEFHNVVAWGRQAEIVNQYLRKGSSVLVEGRLQTRNWQDQQGSKHWRTEIIAERIQLGPKNQGGPAPSTPEGQKQSEDTTPIIELPEEGEEIDVKDIPF
ncbi:MAG: single-stranded DNA-binding protein [Candidatus Sungiibacteriota bacterium]|uniref:Single-stranded DNA-binding protein n=1 Tax=Candidatus Sungiibacteriota bacterium TaxID=2750080 RepID=A0A7T5US63_9BACT|nr:MAG: single-stranded DNA-binding protein [Candidatus Sungbacteria bacterium]